ncbi:MAG: hypothetical protein JST51_13530 [Armatimonadetes bacterium]|nr:hypothetical protein [Armatimonadota bacterium]
MVSRLQGEIPADTLESYRRASSSVHDLLEECEAIRRNAELQGWTVWTMPRNKQAEILCSWNAYVLQILGNEFLDADYRDDPWTQGFVPPITADQVLRFYTQVEGWLNRAHQARVNPDYELDVQVPVDLPQWSEVEPCPNSHLHGMLHAMRSIRDNALVGMAFLGDTAPTDRKRLEQFNVIQQLYSSAMAKARYAEDLHGTNPTQDVHERVEPIIKESIETFYRLGQLLAMTELSSRIPKPAIFPNRPPKKLRKPGTRGFDPWCLTDPHSVNAWKCDAEACNAIQRMWELDPDPVKTIDIFEEIQVALSTGAIGYAKDVNGERIGHFFCCPWGPVYEVLRPVVIAGTHLRVMERFVFDVTAEGMNLGEKFRREIMVANFRRTNRTEYGDPNEPPDH